MRFRLLSILLFLCFSIPSFSTEQDEQLEESIELELEILCQSEDFNPNQECDPESKPLSEISKGELSFDTETPQNNIPEPQAKTSAHKTSQEDSPTEPLWGSINILNTKLPANSTTTIAWYSGHLSGGFNLATPVIVIHGKEAGPTVCITAAIHGDEVNGVEIARRVVQNLKSEELKGTIISVPVVNIDGLWRKDRYISDRRDLNRSFPGHANGSTASRVAHSLFTNIISHCDSLIDLHSGSMYRENITQLRVDLTIPEVAEVAKQFGAISVLQSIAPHGSLRGSATAAGIPAVVMEVGGPFTLDVTLVETAVKALRSYLSSIDMLPHSFFWSSPQPIFYTSKWIRSQQGGILINTVSLGEKVHEGQLLGEISNPINDQVELIHAPFNAVVLGRAQDQFVSAGYAVYNLGERSSIEDLEQRGEKIKEIVAKKNMQQMGLTEKSKDPENETEVLP